MNIRGSYNAVKLIKNFTIFLRFILMNLICYFKDMLKKTVKYIDPINILIGYKILYSWQISFYKAHIYIGSRSFSSLNFHLCTLVSASVVDLDVYLFVLNFIVHSCAHSSDYSFLYYNYSNSNLYQNYEKTC